MRTPLKLAAFGGAIVLAFGGALGVGAAVGDPPPAAVDHGGMSGVDHGAGADSGAAAVHQPGGLMVSDLSFEEDQ